MLKPPWVSIAAAVLAFSWGGQTARANPEPGLYDARSVGLAGAGVAFIRNPAAIFHNPANLEGVEDWAGTFVLTGLFANIGAPLDGPDDYTTTGLAAAPTFLLSGALRVHDRIVVALGAYIYTGYGGDYNDVDSILGNPLFDPADQEVALFVGEVALPASFHLTDELDVGLGLRVPYARQDVRLHQEVLPGSYRPIEQHVSGWGAPGVLLGATWRPSDRLAIAAAYRSKVSVGMSGDVSVLLIAGGEEIVVPAETKWFVPHMTRVGVTAGVLDKLDLTGEFRIQFHEEANKEQVFDLTPDGGDPPLPGFEEIAAPLEWKNVFNGIVAAEYHYSKKVPLRVGYSFGNGATPEKAAQFFNTPPGFLHSFHAGFGLHYEHYEFDFGAGLSHGSEEVGPQEGRCVPGETIKVGCEGKYTVLSSMIGASVTYTP